MWLNAVLSTPFFTHISSLSVSLETPIGAGGVFSAGNCLVETIVRWIFFGDVFVLPRTHCR
jgi:hypothetical protein